MLADTFPSCAPQRGFGSNRQELLAAYPHQRIGLAQNGGDLLGHPLQGTVANQMAMLIVDQLKWSISSMQAQ